MALRRFGITALVAALLTPPVVLAGATPAFADGAAEALAVAEAEGTVQVIVQLDVPAVPEAILTASDATEQRDEIDAVAADVLADVDDDDITGVRGTDTIPYLALEATPDAIEQLATSDAVVSIQLDAELHADLDSSTGVVQSTTANSGGWKGTGSNVAILDTGVDLTHEFFNTGSAKIHPTGQACFSLRADCPNGLTSMTGAGAGASCTYSVTTLVTGDCFHGTHVAGIAAGVGPGGVSKPDRGVAIGAGIVPVNVFSHDLTVATEAVTFFSDVVLGLDWVNANHVSLNIASVNMSIGGDIEFTTTASCDATYPSVKTAIDALRAANIPTVVSSGNDSFRDGLSAPACISSAVPVGATSGLTPLASFSNIAPLAAFPSLVLAPGSGISSARPPVVGDATHDDYTGASGTSMAAPHVAGAWAVIREAVPTASVASVLAALQATGEGVTTSGITLARIEINDALLSLHPQAGPPPSVSGAVGDGQVALTWTEPLWLGTSGAITDYEVTVTPTTGVTGAATRAVGGTTRALTFTGLTNGTAYTFSVVAKQTAVTGDARSSAGLVPLALPSAPTGVAAVATNGRATVSWTASSGGGITSYAVTSDPATTTQTTSATSLVFAGLTNGTPYTFAVTATNAIGTSPASVASAPVTPLPTAPGPPADLAAVATSDGASLTWSPPGDDGGSPVTGYALTTTAGTIAATSTVTSATLTGTATAATITVAATNAIGTSTAVSIVVTPVVVAAGGGGGGGGGGGAATTTTTRPSTTTTTAPRSTTSTTQPPATTTTTVAPTRAPGASVGNGDVITIRDGEPVVITRAAPAGADVVAGAATPSGDGAWSVTATGEVFVRGDAPDLGDTAGRTLNAPIVGIAPTRTGDGYWLLGRDGGIFSFGDAAFHGSTGGMRLNQAVVGMSSTPTGDGYWLFAGDGGIFTFGDARFFGSTGALRLNAPITTMAATPDARGYWLLGSDGGVFTFGTARFFGSTGGRTDVPPIEALVPTSTGRGYYLIGTDGRILRFGDA